MPLSSHSLMGAVIGTIMGAGGPVASLAGAVLEVVGQHDRAKLIVALLEDILAERGWVEAQHLATGDVILAADGTTGIVEAVKVIDAPQVMHNLSVELVATYVVGSGRWVGA